MLHDVLMTPKTAGFTYHSKQGEFNRCPIEIDLFSPLHFLKVIAMRPIDFSQTFISKHIVITALILIATNSLIGQNAVFISANDAKRKMPLSDLVILLIIPNTHKHHIYHHHQFLLGDRNDCKPLMTVFLHPVRLIIVLQ